LGLQGHALFANPPHQRIHHVLGLIAGRKDPSPALDHGTNPQLFKEGHQVRGEKSGESLAQETATVPKVRDELGQRSHVGQVAAPLAGDA